jgi:hypothetical protein
MYSPLVVIGKIVLNSKSSYKPSGKLGITEK